MPYCVGTKNELVVTWLTTTNLYSGCDPKIELEPLLLDALDPQALSSVLTEPAATPGERCAAHKRTPVERHPVEQRPIAVVEPLDRFVDQICLGHLRLLKTSYGLSSADPARHLLPSR